MKHWRTVVNKKMFIVSTDRILPYLTYYHNKFESILTQVEFVKCERLILYSERDDETLEEMIRKKSKSYTQTRCQDFLKMWDCQSFSHLELFIVPMHFASLSELKTDIRLVIVVIHVLAKNSVKSPHGVVHLTC